MKKFFGPSLLLGLAASTLTAQTALNFGNLPLWFEADHGQAEVGTRYIARTGNSEFVVSPTGATFALRQANGKMATCTMQFVTATPLVAQASRPCVPAPISTCPIPTLTGETPVPLPTIYGTGELAGKINHLIGNNPAQWQTGVATFGQVRVDHVYPGINVVYYGNGRQLEYDFNLAAGVNPQTIAIHFDGAEKVAVNAQGELVVSLNGGEVTQHQPVIYQTIGATRHEITGGYKTLDAHTVSFAVGSYDHNQPLVIDPILSYSTFFGGDNGEIARSIALDKSGNVFLAGQTLSTVFTNISTNILAGAYQSTFKGGAATGDAFVAKLNTNGSLVYFTYLGGSADDVAYGVAVDTGGNAYITGTTGSTDFPTNRPLFGQNASKYIQSKNGNYYLGDSFVTKLNSNGTALVYSTYLGGYGQDLGTAIAVDTNGNAYIVGWTSSTNFPVTSKASQTNLLCTNSLYFNGNAFVVEITDNGTNLNRVYSSYLGGHNFDWATGIALDNANNIYVTGFTASTNFPTTNAIIYTNVFSTLVGTNTVLTNYVTDFKNLNGITNLANQTYDFDAFVTKFSPGFSNVVYSTFLGGSGHDTANGIAVDGAGNAYVVGGTISPDFPVKNAPARLTSYVVTNVTGINFWTTNAFLTQVKFDPNLNPHATIGFSTVFGGSLSGYGGFVVDTAQGVAVDKAGNIFVVGSTTSTNFPVTPENLYGSLQATNSGGSDVFVTALASNATAVLYSACLGGLTDDFGYAIATDANGGIYVAGLTLSTNFPTVNAWQPQMNGPNDAFVTKIIPAGPLVLRSQSAGSNIVVSWPLTNDLSSASLGLETSTNLISTNWLALTNPPVLTNGFYLYAAPRTNRTQFFRFHQYTATNN